MWLDTETIGLIIMVGSIILLTIFLWRYSYSRWNIPLKIKKPRKLNNKEAEFMADYFHNEETKPDIDGYMGCSYLPEEVMKIYKKKYSKERDWEDKK